MFYMSCELSHNTQFHGAELISNPNNKPITWWLKIHPNKRRNKTQKNILYTAKSKLMISPVISNVSGKARLSTNFSAILQMSTVYLFIKCALPNKCSLPFIVWINHNNTQLCSFMHIKNDLFLLLLELSAFIVLISL